MVEATLSSKNQLVLPKEARTAMGVKAGDRLLVVVHEGATIVMPKPKSHVRAIQKLVGAGGYGKGYLKKERKSWAR